jgi:hypothetical protein
MLLMQHMLMLTPTAALEINDTLPNDNVTW